MASKDPEKESAQVHCELLRHSPALGANEMDMLSVSSEDPGRTPRQRDPMAMQGSYEDI